MNPDKLKAAIAEASRHLTLDPPDGHTCSSAQRLSSALLDLHKENEKLEKELNEQCRLNGIGSEREAKGWWGVKLTNEQIAELLRLEEKAAHAPYKAIKENDVWVNHIVHTHAIGDDIEDPGEQYDLFECPSFETCDFMAKLRNASRALLEELLELRAEVAGLRKGKHET